MLDPVVRNQQTFVVPSLTADGRGIAIGPTLTVVLPTVSHLVGFLRGAGRSQPLAHLLGRPEIGRGTVSGGARVVYLRCPSRGSHSADRLASIARLHQGQVYTGDPTHAVRYRDGEATLGYDAHELELADGQVLYDRPRRRVLNATEVIEFDTLVRRLALTRVAPARAPTQLYLRTPAALAPRLVRRLAQRGAEVAIADLQAGHHPQGLLRIRSLPEGLIDLLVRLPRVTAFTRLHERLFVEYGRAHPLDLAAAVDLMAGDEWLFFAGDRGDVGVAPPAAVFVPADDFATFSVGGRDSTWATAAGPRATGLRWPLRIARCATAQGDPVARHLHGAAALDRLRRLIYLAPTAVLAQTRLVRWGDHAILLGDEAGAFPLGVPLRWATPNLLVPLDATLRPALAPDVLAGLVDGDHTAVFLGHEGFQWRTTEARRLDRRVAVALETVVGAPTTGRPAPELAPTDVSIFRLLWDRW